MANNCIKLLLLTSEQNLCEMALVKNAARNGAVCYHHDSKEMFVLLCLFLPQGPTLYQIAQNPWIERETLGRRTEWSTGIVVITNHDVASSTLKITILKMHLFLKLRLDRRPRLRHQLVPCIRIDQPGADPQRNGPTGNRPKTQRANGKPTFLTEGRELWVRILTEGRELWLRMT